MSERKPIGINFAQRDGSLTILPRPPLLSSNGRGWNDVYVEHHWQPAHEVPESYYRQHIVVTHHLQRQWKLERTLDGKFQVEYSSVGNVVVIPAKAIHKLSWLSAGEFTILALEPSLFARTAGEAIDPDKVELVPHFSKPDPLIYQIVLALIAVLQNHTADSRIYAESMVTALSAHLLQNYSKRYHALQTYEDGLPKYKLRRVLRYVDAHLADDISLNALATEVEMSRYYFCRLFKQSMGMTVYQYLIEQRVERAKELLLQHKRASLQPSKGIIAQIAVQVGFYDQAHLSRYFKKRLGVTPKQWLNQ